MARMTFSNKWGRVAVSKKPVASEAQKSVEDTVREMKNAARPPGGEDYRDWTEVYVRGLADICQGLAAEFDVVCEMTAGLPHLWKGELPRV